MENQAELAEWQAYHVDRADIEARNRIVTRYAGVAVRLLRGISGESGDEITSLAGEWLIHAVEEFDRRAAFATFLGAVFKTKLRDRAWAREHNAEPDLVELTPDIADETEPEGTHEAVREALNALTVREAMLIHKIYTEDRTLPDAAKAMGISPHTARYIKRAALAKLRGSLQG